MSARAEILARLRAALASASPGPAGSGTGPSVTTAAVAAEAGTAEAYDYPYDDPCGETYDETGTGDEIRTGEEISTGATSTGGDTGSDLALFAERLADYRATVHQCGPDGLTAAVTAALTGSSQVVAPGDLPEEWLAGYPGPVLRDLAGSPLPAADLDRAGTTVVTSCAVAIAETGTIVLDGGARQGRRALTLVPDHHVCVVHAGRIVRSVPAALARLADPGRPVTLISGPSATSDIELNRVEGVHGPRRLEVVLVREPEAPR